MLPNKGTKRTLNVITAARRDILQGNAVTIRKKTRDQCLKASDKLI